MQLIFFIFYFLLLIYYLFTTCFGTTLPSSGVLTLTITLLFLIWKYDTEPPTQHTVIQVQESEYQIHNTALDDSWIWKNNYKNNFKEHAHATHTEPATQHTVPQVQESSEY
jgi:hypothetical protein